MKPLQILMPEPMSDALRAKARERGVTISALARSALRAQFPDLPEREVRMAQLTCVQCGGAFEINELKVRNQKYCSRKCAKQAHKAQAHAAYRAWCADGKRDIIAPIGSTRSCAVCFSSFTKQSPRQITCSPECAHIRIKQKRVDYYQAKQQAKKEIQCPSTNPPE